MDGLPREQMVVHPVIGPFLRDFFLQAGQPDEVRAAFEEAMREKQSAIALHSFVPQ
jgi:5,5'-dehydrodivanillate O-demethylase